MSGFGPMPPGDCPTDDRLRAYGQGEVSDAEFADVAAHLRGCPACVARLGELPSSTGAMAAALREAAMPPVPEDSAYWRALERVTGEPAPGVHVKSPRVGDRLGEYQLLEKLGQGGMGTVYRALHTRLDREVAVKLIRRGGDASAISRFEREMKAVGRLGHPNIVQATDAGEIDGVPFLVMEFVAGRDLSRTVREDGPLPVARACDAIRQAAVGLQHAHEAGFIHRDVKPSNLIRTPGGEIKILDLGLVRAPDTSVPDPGTDGSVTAPGGLISDTTIVGTPEYMAPEQKRDSRAVDARADVYGLGATLWYLLTGRAPGDRPLESLGDSPGQLPAALWRRFLAPDPADRFASAGETARTLAKYAESGGRGRRLWQALAGAVAVILIGFALFREFRPPAVPRGGSLAPDVGKLPMTAEEAGDFQREWAERLGLPVTLTADSGMTFVLIPPGEFGLSKECRATVSKPYYLGTHEVTWARFREFVEATGYVSQAEANGMGGCLFVRAAHSPGELPRSESIRMRMDPNYLWQTPGYEGVTEQDPVTQVSWQDTQRFLEWLRERDGVPYRLPTEAEWVWAARAGNISDSPNADPALEPITDRSWFAINSDYRPRAVGQLAPNPWGLHDTLGNVSEWASDWHAPLPVGRFTDWKGPEAPDPKGYHVFVGASYFHFDPQFDYRYRSNSAGSSIGFRVVREID